jgi:hypothetical protein
MSSRRCQDKTSGATSDNWPSGLSRHNRSVTPHFISIFFPIRERIHRKPTPLPAACTLRILILSVSSTHLRRDCTQHHTARWSPRDVPRTRADHPRLSADVGDIFRRVRRDQDPVWRTAFGHRFAGRKVRTSLSRAVCEGLSAYRPGAFVVAPHPVSNDSRRDQHDMHQSIMGHQNALHGTVFVLSFPVSSHDLFLISSGDKDTIT